MDEPDAVTRTRGVVLVAALVGFLTIVAVGFDDGGFFARTWNLGTIAFAAVAVVTLVLRRPPRLGTLELVFLLGLGLLTAWMLASAAWGIQGTDAVEEARRAFFYFVAACAFVLVAERRAAPALLAGVFAGIVAVCGYALIDRAVTSRPLDRFQGNLLIEPIGYANALGILAAIGTLLGVGFVLRPGGRGRRALLAAATAVVGLALVLTESRGAWLAFGCGLAVLFVREARWPSARTRWIAATAAAVLAALVVVLASPSLGHRPSYWRAALDDANDHAPLGSGAGSFGEYWLQHRELEVEVRDAHSLYLEALAELGPVGLALVVLVVSVPLVAATRGHGDGLLSATLGAYVAFAVHAGLDWDWEVPVTSLAALACAAALTSRER